jgi:hypothetical protein
MKKIILILLASAALCSAQSYHYNRGYYRSNGTYVQPHWQTNPNRTRLDNWSTYPNINPFTGRQGTIRVMPRSGYYDRYGIWHP